jgi:hypothetical protein
MGEGLVALFLLQIVCLGLTVTLNIGHSACRSWIDSKFQGTGHHGQVNKTLGNICRLLWPGMVTLPSGQEVPAMTWEHYRYAVNAQYGNAQGVVWNEFWV